MPTRACRRPDVNNAERRWTRAYTRQQLQQQQQSTTKPDDEVVQHVDHDPVSATEDSVATDLQLLGRQVMRPAEWSGNVAGLDSDPDPVLQFVSSVGDSTGSSPPSLAANAPPVTDLVPFTPPDIIINDSHAVDTASHDTDDVDLQESAQSFVCSKDAEAITHASALHYVHVDVHAEQDLSKATDDPAEQVPVAVHSSCSNAPELDTTNLQAAGSANLALADQLHIDNDAVIGARFPSVPYTYVADTQMDMEPENESINLAEQASSHVEDTDSMEVDAASTLANLNTVDDSSNHGSSITSTVGVAGSSSSESNKR